MPGLFLENEIFNIHFSICSMNFLRNMEVLLLNNVLISLIMKTTYSLMMSMIFRSHYNISYTLKH